MHAAQLLLTWFYMQVGSLQHGFECATQMSLQAQSPPLQLYWVPLVWAW